MATFWHIHMLMFTNVRFLYFKKRNNNNEKNRIIKIYVDKLWQQLS